MNILISTLLTIIFQFVFFWDTLLTCRANLPGSDGGGGAAEGEGASEGKIERATCCLLGGDDGTSG